VCFPECECAFPSVSVVAPDECDSAVSCISSVKTGAGDCKRSKMGPSTREHSKIRVICYECVVGLENE
jgi:hypothetical protein